MKTTWSEFVDWKSAREAMKDSTEKLNSTVADYAKKTLCIADLLRKHGPIVHDGHVYWLHDNKIICEPCVDSLSAKLED